MTVQGWRDKIVDTAGVNWMRSTKNQQGMDYAGKRLIGHGPTVAYPALKGHVHTAPFRFYSFLLMKTLSVHIAPFSNEYAMKTIGVHTFPLKRKTVLLIPF